MTFDKPGPCPACGNSRWHNIVYEQPLKPILFLRVGREPHVRARCRTCSYESKWILGSATLTFDGYFSYICEPSEAAK